MMLKRLDFITLEKLHVGNYFIFSCNNHKVNSIKTAYSLQHNPPLMPVQYSILLKRHCCPCRAVLLLWLKIFSGISQRTSGGQMFGTRQAASQPAFRAFIVVYHLCLCINVAAADLHYKFKQFVVENPSNIKRKQGTDVHAVCLSVNWDKCDDVLNLRFWLDWVKRVFCEHMMHMLDEYMWRWLPFKFSHWFTGWPAGHESLCL